VEQAGEWVFVYGTLRRHEENHHYLQKAQRGPAPCWTYGQLFDTGYGYPAMVDSGTERVYGELYLVTPAELKALDELEDYYGEGCDNLYDRVRRTIHTDRGEVDAYVYVWAKETDGFQPIPSGDWKLYRMKGN
jgi:gamma-glutamylcyclotransferase (GGCT)/AIG2-like uncharacterized protein YtfP